MQINYDTEKLNSALGDFYRATGIEIGILRPDFSSAGERRVRRIPYCEAVQRVKGEGACHMSDRELLRKCKESGRAEMSVCHAGLVNVAVPLFYGDTIIGYIIFGCIRTISLPDAVADFSSYPDSDRELIESYYRDMPIYNDEQIESIANVAIMLAKYILLEKMLKPSFDEGIEAAVEYINSNLTSDLSISAITRETNISKSVLYRGFHSAFGMTVSEYIKMRRIEYSISLMHSEPLSVEELAQRSGFAGASYYSREFKRRIGVSPAKYRRGI